MIANDLSESATAAMRRNVDLNGLGPSDEQDSSETPAKTPSLGKVRVNEGDAWYVYTSFPIESNKGVAE